MTRKEPSELRDVLTTDELVEHWTDVIQDRIEDERKKEDLRDWIETYRDETLSILEDVGDSEDVHTSLVLRYIEMKCQWIIFNN